LPHAIRLGSALRYRARDEGDTHQQADEINPTTDIK
jgi:hypothetical protein